MTAGAHCDDPAQLGRRRPPRLRHLLERCPGQVRLVGQGDAGGPRLHHHHADGVGDDIVQLPGYPVALALGGKRQAHLLLGPQPSRRRRQSPGQAALAGDEQAGRGRNDHQGKRVFDHVRDVQRNGSGGENGAHHDPVDHQGSQLSDLAAGDAPCPGRVHGQQYRQPHSEVVVLQCMSAGQPLAADCPGTGDYHGGFGSPAAPCYRRRSGQRADHARSGQAGGRGASHPQADHHGGQSPGNDAVDERWPATPGPQGRLRDLSCSAHLASVRRLTSLDVLRKNDLLVVAEATGESLLRPATAGPRRHMLIP